MSRSIKVGDLVEVFLPPDSVVYKIVDIDQDGWIYLRTEDTSRTDEKFSYGILTYDDDELKILGSKDIPYKFEFIPEEDTEEGEEDGEPSF